MNRKLWRHGRNFCAAVPWVGGSFFFLSLSAVCRTALSHPRLEASRQARDFQETTVACPPVKVRKQARTRRFWPFAARPPSVPVANIRAPPSKVLVYLYKPTQGGIAYMAVLPLDGFTARLEKSLSRRACSFVFACFCLICFLGLFLGDQMTGFCCNKSAPSVPRLYCSFERNPCTPAKNGSTFFANVCLKCALQATRVCAPSRFICRH